MKYNVKAKALLGIEGIIIADSRTEAIIKLKQRSECLPRVNENGFQHLLFFDITNVTEIKE